MKVLRSGIAVIKENRVAYIILNVAYYGLVICGMVFVAFAPSVQQRLLALVGQAFTAGPLAAVGSAYTGGEVVKAALLTFVVNLFVGSLVYITLPSMVIPFSGMLMGVLRAILWGLLLSPTAPELRLVMIPHSITLILEGQGYILALLAVYAHGKAFLFPRSVGVEAQGDGLQRMARLALGGYRAGVKRTARLYVLVVIVLAVAAIYEALEVILLARFAGGV
jgi:hypothetical protein